MPWLQGPTTYGNWGWRNGIIGRWTVDTRIGFGIDFYKFEFYNLRWVTRSSLVEAGFVTTPPQSDEGQFDRGPVQQPVPSAGG